MDLEDVEEMSNDEIALAQNARRKSTRRSLLPFPVMGDSNNSSPKVLVRRRSLGWPLLRRSPSPDPIVTKKARKSFDPQLASFAEPKKMPDLPHNTSEPLKPDLPPPLNDQPPSEVSECPPLPQTEPPSKASECPSLPQTEPPSKASEFPALPQTKPPSSQVAESSQPSSALQSYANADQRTVVKSADELHDRYLEELAEWPKFLSGLEDLANHPLQTPALSAEAVDENPVLAPFSHYLKPSSAKNSLTDDPIAVQQRIKRSYRRCVCSLISLSRRRKERHLILSGAKSDWEEWCTRERVKLMPSTAEACNSSKRDIFSQMASFSVSTFSDQSST